MKSLYIVVSATREGGGGALIYQGATLDRTDKDGFSEEADIMETWGEQQPGEQGEMRQQQRGQQELRSDS